MQFIRGLIKSTIRGIANHLKWFSIIWFDRDFDYRYIYFMLEHKLKSMEATFSDPRKIYQIDESRLQILRYIRISRILLQRLIADDFMTKEEHELFNSIEHEWIPCKDNPKLMEMRTIYSPPPEILDSAWDNSYRKKNKTRRLFFLILEKRIEHWWD